MIKTITSNPGRIVIWEIPILESIRALKIKRSLSVMVLYSIFFALYFIVIGVNFSPSIQSVAMKKFHLGAHPFGRWALCQLFPSMYNFKNEILISPGILPSDFTGSMGMGLVRFTVNHYPMRMIYFTDDRANIMRHLPFYVYLRSRFRGNEMVSSYVISGSGRYFRIMMLNFYERTNR